MPVFSVTAVDRIVEPVAANPSLRSSSMETESLSATDRKFPFSFYPLLYVTPPQQRPPSPTSFSPSPYVLNYKRRNPVRNGIVGAEATVGTHNNGVQENTFSHSSANVDGKHQREGATVISTAELKSEKLMQNSEKGFNESLVEDENSHLLSAGQKWSGDKAAKVSRQQVESEVFEIEVISGDQTANNHPSKFSEQSELGQIGIMSGACSGKKANGVERKDLSLSSVSEGSHLGFSLASPTSEEFFDAPDSPFDDSTSDDETCRSISTTRSHIKSGQKVTMRLQEEISRRVQAEKALASLQMRWNELVRRYYGVSSPPGPFGASDDILEQADPLELLSERLSIARFVAGAIASASVRAEKEEELESIVIAKNREISRLRDKLQYYELVNHEMSQRNQEAVEIAQRRRRRHRTRVRWALGCFGAAIVIGSTGLLCHKFIPRARNGQSQ